MATATKTTKTAPATKKVQATAVEPAKTTPKRTSTYRDAEGFKEALKTAKGTAKGDPVLGQALQLITHLAWKTPGGTVGWTKGTTPDVISYADDIAAPVGTAIPDAMDYALSACAKAAKEPAAKEAVDALSKVIKAHEA